LAVWKKAMSAPRTPALEPAGHHRTREFHWIVRGIFGQKNEIHSQNHASGVGRLSRKNSKHSAFSSTATEARVGESWLTIL
jgi:hypothetical protein